MTPIVIIYEKINKHFFVGRDKNINENGGAINFTEMNIHIFVLVSMDSSLLLQNVQPTSQKGMPVQRPVFDDISAHNVTAVVGQTTVLHCRIKHVSDRTVSIQY